MCVPPQNSSVEILTLKDDRIRMWGLWEGLSHKGRAVMNEIKCLIKEAPERPPGPSTTWGLSKKVHEPGRGPSPEADHTSTSQPPELKAINLCDYKPFSLWCTVIAAQTDWDTHIHKMKMYKHSFKRTAKVAWK